jgi:hypothetical protein
MSPWECNKLQYNSIEEVKKKISPEIKTHKKYLPIEVKK